MVEPLTSGALVLGAGWFANKLLGPSADALGESLKSFGSSRIKKIVKLASAKVVPEKVTSLPPGFAINFFQKASFSDDDDFLTELWANLLAASSTNFSNRHAAYVEILSQLTTFDALTVGDLVPAETAYHPQLSMPVNCKIELKLKLANEVQHLSQTKGDAQAEFDRLLKLTFDWPGRITSARIHYQDGATTRPLSGGAPDQFASFDNLTRLGLIEKFEVDISAAPYETALEGVLVTMLGVGFVQTCRGSL